MDSHLAINTLSSVTFFFQNYKVNTFFDGSLMRRLMSLSYMCAKFEAKTKSWLSISMTIGNGAKQPDFVQRLTEDPPTTIKLIN